VTNASTSPGLLPFSSNFSAYSPAMSSVTSQMNSPFAQRLTISLFGLRGLSVRSAAKTTFVSRTARSMVRGVQNSSFRSSVAGTHPSPHRGQIPPRAFSALIRARSTNASVSGWNRFWRISNWATSNLMKRATRSPKPGIRLACSRRSSGIFSAPMKKTYRNRTPSFKIGFWEGRKLEEVGPHRQTEIHAACRLLVPPLPGCGMVQMALHHDRERHVHINQGIHWRFSRSSASSKAANS